MIADVAEWVLNACAIEDNKSQCSYGEQLLKKIVLVVMY